MIFDDFLLFADRQAITATGASENSVYLGPLGRAAYAPTDIKTGGSTASTINIVMLVQEDFAGLTSLSVVVQAAGSEDFSDAQSIVQTGSITASELKFGRRLILPPFEMPSDKRWLRLVFNVEGTGSAGVVTAGVVDSLASQGAGKGVIFLRPGPIAAPGPTAPSWTAQPFFTASSPTVGDTLTIDPGDLSGTQPITIEVEYFRLNGVDKSGELSGLSWDSTGETAGTVTARLRATNSATGPGSPVLSDEITVELANAQVGVVTENVVDFAAATGVDMFAGASTLPANAPAFTLALKTTVQALAGSGQGYIAGTSINEFFRIDQALGRLQLQIRDTAEDEIFSDTSSIISPNLSPNDEIAFVLAANQSVLRLVAGIKRAGSDTVTRSTLVNSTHTTANNLVLLRYLNTRNSAAANSVNMHYHGVWAAAAFIDPVAHFSNFFDANNVLTPAMFNGDAIQGVDRGFGQTGNAAAWNAMSGVAGQITDVPFDQGGSPPDSPGERSIASELEMRAFLSEAKADPTITDGLTVKLAAGLDLTGIEPSAWEDALIDNPAQQIMTIRSVVPFNPAVMRLVGLASSVPGDGKVIGGVALEDIRFDLTHIPLDVPEEDNTQVQIACLNHDHHNLMRRVRIKRNYFVGSNIDFRIDNREPVNRLIGMNFANCEDLEVSGNLFDLISTGGIVAGSDVLVTRNQFMRCNEDFWRISRPKIGGVGFGCTNYRVIENVFHDSWSRFRLHPDFLQIDDYHSSPHAGQQLEFEIERNVVWLGDGMYCPVSPSGYGQDASVMWDTLPATMPMTDRRVNRIRQTTAGTTTLATGAPEGTQVAVQLEARDTLYEPITFEPGVGESFIAAGTGSPLANVTMIRPNQTVEFTMGANGVMTVQEYTGDNNMVQSNYSANKGTIRGIIRNNIWATNGSISARLGSNWVTGSAANQNTMMQVRPGDVTGDGVPNTHADGFVDPGNNPKIVIETADATVNGNIVKVVNNNEGAPTSNNREVDWSDPSAVTDVFPLVTIENGGLKNFPTDLQDMVARALTVSAAATAAKQGAGWDDVGNAVDWTWTDSFGSGPDLALGNGSVAGGSGPQFAAAA